MLLFFLSLNIERYLDTAHRVSGVIWSVERPFSYNLYLQKRKKKITVEVATLALAVKHTHAVAEKNWCKRDLPREKDPFLRSHVGT